MKAIINPKELAKVLKKASPVIKKNSIIPILDFVKMEFQKDKVTVTATDLETIIIATVDCECKVPFTIIVEYSRLIDLCSKIPEPISFDASGEQILITGDTAKFKFTKAHDEDHFPVAEESDFIFSVEVDADFFSSLASANTCRHTDNLRAGLNAPCIHVKKDDITLVGTDALVLFKSRLKIKTGHEASIMVPDQFVQITKDFKEGKVSISDKFIKVETTTATIISRLLDDKFCLYESILPTEINFNILVNRGELISKLAISGVAANLSTHMTVFNFADGGIKLITQDVDFGTEAQEQLKSTGDAGIDAIGINGNQMLKLLNLLNSEELELAFTDPKKSIYVRPANDPNTLCLIQPLMIQ